MTSHPYTLIEITGKDADDWPELTPEEGRRFEQQLQDAQDDDELLDGVDLDGERFFVHKRDVKRVTHWE
jgi:hypothetical protein